MEKTLHVVYHKTQSRSERKVEESPTLGMMVETRLRRVVGHQF